MRDDELERKAKHALAEGDIEAALDAYQQLELKFGSEPSWSRQVATLHQRLGHRDLCIEALDRAASRCVAKGEPVKAIAATKLLLAIEPDHEPTRKRLTSLLGVPPERKAKLDWLVDDLMIDGEAAPLLAARPPSNPRGGLMAIPLPDAVPRKSDVGAMPLFEMLTPDELDQVLLESRLVSFPPGQRVFGQGEYGDALYVIVEGGVRVWLEDSGKEIAELDEGDFFGEIAVLAGRPRTASVSTNRPTELLEISRSTVVSLVQKSPEALPLLLSIFRSRIADVVARTSPLFSQLGDDDRDKLRACFSMVDVGEKTAVIDQGGPNRGLFVLVDGELTVTHVGNGAVSEIAKLQPGHVFGEISTITQLPPVATVTANSRALVLFLERSAVEPIFAAHPAVLAYAAELANSRLDELTRAAVL